MKLIQRKEIKRDDGTVYMIRWSILSPAFFSIKIHKFIISDNDCMHDHPWAFISIILWGGYTEETPAMQRFEGGGFFWPNLKTKSIFYRPGSILYRRSRHIHRINIDPGKKVYSLVITFKKRRMWGFWTKSGWLAHFKYFSNGTCN